MPASLPRISLFVVIAAAIVAGVLTLLGRDPSTTPAIVPHFLRVAPPKSQGAINAHGKVYGTKFTPQQAADAAIENSAGPNGIRPAVQPLAAKAFRTPIKHYRHYAVGVAGAMAGQVSTLEGDLRANDRAAARRSWAGAYADYMRIGAAYGALGALDTAIDGRDRGLHRIERGLWTGASPRSLVPYASTLKRNVAKLPHALRTGSITTLEYATRAHEILEDAQRDQLSGVLPRWSGAGVLAVAADLAATKVVIGTLNATLAGREDVLPQVNTRLLQLGQTLSAIQHSHHGTYPPISGLTLTEHERLTGALGAALEALSGVPGDLETRLPPPTPKLPKGGAK